MKPRDDGYYQCQINMISFRYRMGGSHAQREIDSGDEWVGDVGRVADPASRSWSRSSSAVCKSRRRWSSELSVIGFVLFVILATGFFVVNPNASKVLLLFGDYKGTVKAAGFHWTNPFMTKKAVSLRARNLNGDKLKVNRRGREPGGDRGRRGVEGETKRPRPRSTWMTSWSTSTSRASRRCGTWRPSFPTTVPPTS